MRSPKDKWEKSEQQLWREMPLSQKVISIVLTVITLCCVLGLAVFYIINPVVSIDPLWVWLLIGIFLVTLVILFIYAYKVVNKGIMERKKKKNKD